jgi:hypothetical protein
MLEHEFRSALVDPSILPHARFPIYRNNVSGALIGALRVRFPVVEQLVGGDFFYAMAGSYVAAHKPISAVLIHYGASFADFIESFDGASDLNYLADVARFENAWWLSYHAAEAPTFDPQKLVALGPEQWGGLRFKFHPATQLFKTDHGVVTIWQWHQVKENPEALVADGVEFAIVSRSDAQVEVRLITAESYHFLYRLVAGESLEKAVGATTDEFPDFELQEHLTALMQLNLLTGIST